MVINLTLIQMGLAFLLPLTVIFLLHKNELKIEKDVMSAVLKMVLQLLFVGYVLTLFLIRLDSSIGSLYILVMLFFATIKIKDRLSGVNNIYLKNAKKAMVLGSIATLLYFILVVVNPDPKIDPQYVIPLYGMILGNTLTATVLAVNTLNKELNNEKAYIDTLIALGVKPYKTLNKTFAQVLKVAITPTLTSMGAMGLVSLPGMMTGQILSGTEPLIAIKYQIAIMFAILASASFATVAFIHFMRKDLINSKNQLDLS